MVATYNSFESGKSHSHSYPHHTQTKEESYATSTDERCLVKITKVMILKMMTNIEMKYTVPFICPQDHFADQDLLSFNELSQ